MQAPTPPSELHSSVVLGTAINLLKAKSEAIGAVAASYARDETAQRQFFEAMLALHSSILMQGKLVLTGIGKSLKIAEKLIATLHSFGIPAAALHPTDALHGDLGNVKPQDVIIMISASGETSELLQLWDHLRSEQCVMVLTCVPLSRMARRATHIFPVLFPESHHEVNVYGLSAPTVTTTACLAVGDAICITLYEMIESNYKRRRSNFGHHHPGGAIGRSYKEEPAFVPEIMGWSQLPKLPECLQECDELALWRLATQKEIVLIGDVIYYSKCLLGALQIGSRAVPGYPVSHLPRVQGPIQDCTQLSLLVEQNEPQGLVWSSHWI